MGKNSLSGVGLGLGLAGPAGARSHHHAESHRLASVTPELNQVVQKRFSCRLSLQGVMRSLNELHEHVANFTSLLYCQFRCMFTVLMH